MSSFRRQCLFIVFTLLIVLTPQLICFAGDETPEKQITIGAIVPTLSAEFWNRYVTFIKKGAAELDVRVIMINADNKVDSMHSHLKSLLDKKVDGLIYVPYWNSGRMGLKLAAEANVPVILTDVYIPGVRPQDDFANYLAFVGPADADAGYQMALALFEATEAAQDGKKHIGVVNRLSKGEEYLTSWADPENAEDRNELKKAGIITSPAQKDIAKGIEAVQSKLKLKQNGKPSLFIFNDCKNTCREFSIYHYPTGTKSKNPADVPVQKNDHTVDDVRYVIYSEQKPMKKGSVCAA